MPSIDAKAIRFFRRKARLTQQSLADKLEVSKRQVAEWERPRPHEARMSIRQGNFEKLCRVLRAPADQLSGEAPLPVETDGDSTRYQFSVRLTQIARFNYELIEWRYGLSREELVAAAPMLFLLLARQSLRWRKEKLQLLRTAVRSIQEHGEAFIAPEVLESDEAFLEALEREEQAIGSEEIFAPSNPDLDYQLAFSNRFADFLLEEARDADIGFELHGPISIFPEYLVCRDALEEICGGRDAPQLARAAYALAHGSVRLHEIPDEMRDESRNQERSEWLANKVPTAEEPVRYCFEPNPYPYSGSAFPALIADF